MKYTFKIPGPRGMSASAITPQYIPLPSENIRDLILHALIARIAYTDNSTEEFLIKLEDDHTLEVNISREKLDQLIGQIVVGPKVQDFIDWLTGSRISNLEDQLADIQRASKTKYGIVKIGDGIDVFDGVISLSDAGGWETIVTAVDYTIVNNPTHVICTDSVNVTLPSSPTGGYRSVIKNATSDKTVNIIGTLDGNVNPSLDFYEAVSLVYNGTDWSII